MVRSRLHFPITVVAMLAAIAVGGCTAKGPRTRVTYERFRAMTSEELARLQGAIVYLGDERKPIPTLGFVAVGRRFDARRLLLLHKEGPRWQYLNDYLVPFRFAATTEELKALIDTVGTLSQMVDGHVDSAGAVSFTLTNAIEGDTLAFEAILNKENGRRLFGKMLAAMSANVEAVQELRGMGCVTDLLPLAPPRDATRDVSVDMGNTWPDPRTRESTVTIRVTNDSQKPLRAPLTLALSAKRKGVEWIETEGRTCRVRPPGIDFVTLPVDSILPAKASVEMVAHFRTPHEGPIRFSAIRVFEGEGTR